MSGTSDLGQGSSVALGGTAGQRGGHPRWGAQGPYHLLRHRAPEKGGTGGLGDPTTTAQAGVASSGGSGGAGSTGPSSLGGTGGVAGPKSLYVLLIGASYTYENDLAGWLRRVAVDGSPAIESESVASPGQGLEWHWQNTTPETAGTLAMTARGALARGWAAGVPWSHVVLQAYTGEVINSDGKPSLPNASFQTYASTFAGAIRSFAGAPVFFENWGFAPDHPDFGQTPPLWGGGSDAMQDGLLASYRSAALNLRIPMARVGEAWREVRTQYSAEIPESLIYQTDHRHATPNGTYLAACVLYVRLTGRPVPVTGPFPAEPTQAQADRLRSVAFSQGAL